MELVVVVAVAVGASCCCLTAAAVVEKFLCDKNFWRQGQLWERHRWGLMLIWMVVAPLVMAVVSTPRLVALEDKRRVDVADLESMVMFVLILD